MKGGRNKELVTPNPLSAHAIGFRPPSAAASTEIDEVVYRWVSKSRGKADVINNHTEAVLSLTNFPSQQSPVSEVKLGVG